MRRLVDKHMNTPHNKSDSSDVKYLSKQVLVNGQFVTLYSVNGQTWISSPEDIPDLMARLENARIVLNNGEKPGDTPTEKAKTVEGNKDKESAEAAPKLPPNKYRMKGPKPRPILRQGGLVIKGTPIEPISASSTVVELADVKVDAGEGDRKKEHSKPQKKHTVPKGVANSSKALPAKRSAVPVGSSRKQTVPAAKTTQSSKGVASKVVSKTSGKVAPARIVPSAKKELKGEKSSSGKPAKQSVKKPATKAVPAKKHVAKKTTVAKKQGTSSKRGKSSR